ncbi:hypothetical protein P13BB106kb_p048 [Pectobacterium phage DU_PP_V]|uniref:Uncharacterized protein n=1 Tax=Pectobacterium phage DU_PP_V TaxID=2041492 RepID=A0A2D2W6V9_9CAUD|nr:hypothetical protein HOS40_gp121 [Pectobacterium phage DU_PP_V]ATS94032.1 hypothetical protein P13BB106kb_p048 [Pectobacterium phage DU_PP_V]
MIKFLVTTCYNKGSKRGKPQPPFCVYAKSEFRLRTDFFNNQKHLDVLKVEQK